MTKHGRHIGTAFDRRGVLKSGIAAAGALLLPASVRAVASGPRHGGTLRVSMPYNPAALDPMTGRNLPDFNTLYAIFDALIDYDPPTLDLKPGLAKAWRFTDPKTLVLDLVEGAEFHDGTPFDAGAAKFNLDRYLGDPRSNVKSDLNTVRGCSITGKSQITIQLKKPNSGLPAILTNRCGLMVSPASVRRRGNVDRMPVGTGPFKFVDWRDNDKITVTRNKNYWRAGLPYLDGIELRIIGELNTVARTVTSGQADLALNIGAQQKIVADRLGSTVSYSTPSLTFFGAFLNYGQPPLRDVRLRQAMNYALDRDTIDKIVNGGLGETTSTIMPRSFWACDPATAGYYTHDPERARKLVTEAGHAGGIEIAAWGWPDQSSMQRQELIVSQLAQAGIRLNLEPAAPPQAMEGFMIKKQRAMLISPQGALPDPSQIYERLFAADALRNAGSVELPGFRPLMDATTEAQDRPARRAAFAKLQRFVVEQAMELPQFIAPAIAIASPKVKNYVDGLLGTPKFTEVWLAL
jgi:peptide/nickel transport system substrate-binding protein/glutathione transport system substrate-binding protein